MGLDSDVHATSVSPSRSSRDEESSSRVVNESGISVTHVIDNVTEAPAGASKNSVLTKFATEFLSLYCSELPSAAHIKLDQKLNGLKRNCSPSLVGANSRLCTKKQCLTIEEVCPTEVANLQSDNSSPLEGTSLRRKPEEGIMEHPPKLQESCGDSSKAERKAFTGLRKCSNTPTSGSCVQEHYTPGSVNISCTRKTPRSACRSSIFSPGEEFWNEAIQVADCLFAPRDQSSYCDVFDAENPQMEVHPSKDNNFCGLLKNACCRLPPENVKDIYRIESSSVVNPLDLALCSRLKDKGVETVPEHTEASPLPVRHFDFSRVETNFDSENKKSEIGYENDESIIRPNISCHVEATVDKLTSEKKHTSSAISEDTNADELTSPAVYVLGASDNTLKLKTGECTQIEKSYNEIMLNDAGVINGPDLPDVDYGTRSHPDVNFKYGAVSTPSSSTPLKDSLQLTCWLPSELCSVYMKKGISKLYPWQVDCLQVEGVLQKRNLVYCASTSAGKSFVAEILILRQIISTGKIALLVLPYVSLCAEKAEHFELLLEPLGKHVRSFYGNQGSGTLPKDTSVAVCTIEKANFLINRLLEEGRLSEIGIVVVDELHMVGDQHRGYLLELMLTKLRYASGEGNADSCSEGSAGSNSGKSVLSDSLQIIGMSATMPNVAAVADWLHAALYMTDFRPVPLEEYIKVGNNIFNKKLDAIRTIPKISDLGGKDPDHIVTLCDEVVQEGHSVLLFCSSRKGCESTARHVSKFLKPFPVGTHDTTCEYSDSASVLEALRRCPAGLDPTLEDTISCGVAYHHAGLTVEEREIVETCYRKGLIRVLTATSTLAAGVNLPARRVIFRQPRIGKDFIDGTRYRQMAGRAGRTGIDTRGESILICKQEEVKRITAVLNDCCPPLQSCLSDDKNGMTHAILEVVAGGIVQTAGDIHRYVRCTLLNSTKPFEDVVKSAQDSLRWLCHIKFLEWNEQTQLYTATPLGHASFGSSLSPEESLVVLDDLSRAREGFVLSSDLHLVYLVTPINTDVDPDWDLYYERFMQLSTLDQSVGNRVGVTEPFLMRMAHGAPMHISDRLKGRKKQQNQLQGHQLVIDKRMASNEQTIRIAKRFYVALMLSRLVQEVPMHEVCEAFKVARGMIQVLQENSGRFASMVSLFCEKLGWHDLGGLIAKFQNRVSFGVRAEITELTNIPYVKGSRARALYKAGLRTPLAIAEASIPAIVKALFETSSWNTQESRNIRNLQVGVAKKIKSGARKVVLDQAEEARLTAFSVFKSLGLDVPQLSRPLLSGNCKGSLQVLDMPSDELGVNLGSSSTQEKGVGKPSNDLDTCSGSVIAKVTPSGISTGSENKHDQSIGLYKANEKVTEFGSFFINAEEKSVRVTCNSVFSCSAVMDPPPNCVSAISPSKENLEASFKDEKKADNIDNVLVNPMHCNKGHALDFTNRNISGKGPVNANALPGGFDSFLDQWAAVTEFCFDLHFTRRSELDSDGPFEILGIAVCWQASPVYYINVSRDLIFSGTKDIHNGVSGTSMPDKGKGQYSLGNIWNADMHRWKRISEIMGRSGVRKFTWNLKYQIQVLKSPGISAQRFGEPSFKSNEMTGVKLVGNSHILLPSIIVHDGMDLCIVSWILWPDEESRCSPNLEKVVRKRLTNEAAAAASRDGRWRNQMRRAAHNGCCRRVAQMRALSSVLWKMLVSENLISVFNDIESPLVKVLADMELRGIGVNMEACLQARWILGRKLKELEKEAYKLAGRPFSLYTSADIANILYNHLKLPVPEGSKGKQHPSTDKHSLHLLRCQHPIIPVIKEHRTLAKLLNSTLGSICSRAKPLADSQKYVIMGHWLQTSTATGRLSMEEPNLQCVEHMIEFALHSPTEQHYLINARDFFIPTQDNWMLLAADYSQIELRLMAHFSQDSSLIELLSKPDGDVFTMIAARWTGKIESSVSPQEREQTKRLIYGILYGMGTNTLGEQLGCSSEEATGKIQSFKDSFPGVSAWLRDAVASCRSKGYVQTLKGRKRFLSKINFGNNQEKARAQRQAVNSICQGSAADIIKIAMVNFHSLVIEGHGSDLPNELEVQYAKLKGHCHILLQVHDELVLEVDPSLVREAALLLQFSMESAATLLVPLRVKLKIGKTWGSLEPLNMKFES